MSVNKKEKYIYLPDGRGCVWTCWLADALPVDADEYKQKRKKYTYLMVDVDALQCVRTRMEGRWACKEKQNKKKKRKENIPDPRCGWLSQP